MSPLVYFLQSVANILDPIICPITANPIKIGIVIFGVSNQIRNAMTKGIEAWINSHQTMVNFLYRVRHLPKGIFTIKATIPTHTIFIFLSKLIFVQK
jgi:hypothetical protein